jgi:thioredoxin-like negative regulator of GroEL
MSCSENRIYKRKESGETFICVFGANWNRQSELNFLKLEEVFEKSGEDFLEFFDIDSEISICSKCFDIKSVPVTILFKNGVEEFRYEGNPDISFIERNLISRLN